MQAYNEETAAMYNEIWRRYARAFASAVIAYLESLNPLPEGAVAIDLACGTGDLAYALANAGFSVVGIDISPPMIAHAQRRRSDLASTDHAYFIVGNIVDFGVTQRSASIVTCSYDSINHLETEEDLQACFTRVADALKENGVFIFDMNTKNGLRGWNRIQIIERPSYTIFSRGFFEESTGRAWKKFSGFRRLETGYFEKFDQVIFNTAFSIERVTALLSAAKLDMHHIALLPDLHLPVTDAEEHDRIVIVARHRRG